MISPVHMIRYLRSLPVVTAALDNGRVLEEMVDAFAKSMPRRAIVVTSSGGPEWIGRTHNFVRGRQDVKCYGKTVGDAWELNGIVYNALREAGRANMNGKHVISVRPSGGGIQLREPEGDWPFVFTEYMMVISEG